MLTVSFPFSTNLGLITVNVLNEFSLFRISHISFRMFIASLLIKMQKYTADFRQCKPHT